MSTRMFLQLPGIEGDSTDRDHRGWIDIQHLTWALNNQGAGREGVGIPSLSDITMQRFMDRASVKLAFNCAGCTVFQSAEIHDTIAVGATRKVVMSFKLRSVTITSYSLALAELGVGRAQEVVSLGYRTLEAEYVVRNPRNGDSQGTVRGSYDIALNEVRGI